MHRIRHACRAAASVSTASHAVVDDEAIAQLGDGLAVLHRGDDGDRHVDSRRRPWRMRGRYNWFEDEVLGYLKSRPRVGGDATTKRQ